MLKPFYWINNIISHASYDVLQVWQIQGKTHHTFLGISVYLSEQYFSHFYHPMNTVFYQCIVNDLLWFQCDSIPSPTHSPTFFVLNFSQFFTDSMNLDFLMFNLSISHLRKFSSSNWHPNKLCNLSWKTLHFLDLCSCMPVHSARPHTS